MKTLSPEASRLAAISLLLLLTIFSILYIVLPLINYYQEKSSDLELKRRQLAQFEYLLNNETVIDQELARMDDAGAVDLFLAGSKAAIASANLRELIAQAVRDSGGELISSQEYDAEPIPYTNAVGLQVQVRGEADSLVGLLHTVETLRPLVFVDELAVSSSSKRSVSSQEARRAKSAGSTPSLEVRMNIVGYLLNGEDLQSGSEG